MNMGWFLWSAPPVCTEKELRKLYDNLAEQTHRPVIRFYGEMGQLACRAYLQDGNTSALDDSQQASEMLVAIKALERRFPGLPRPESFDLGSLYHQCRSQLKALREAIELRDSSYMPPVDRGRIHACVHHKMGSIGEYIPHPVPIRLDSPVQVEPIVEFGELRWHRWKQVSDNLDLVWSYNYLHAVPAPGELVPIYDRKRHVDLHDPDKSVHWGETLMQSTRPHARLGAVADVSFDGRRIWYAVAGYGIRIADIAGNTLAAWDDERWRVDLGATRILAFKEGKCLLVSYSQGRTAVFVLTYDDASGEVTHKIVHRAVVQAKKEWKEVLTPDVAFWPLALFRTVDCPDGPIWIARAVDGVTRYKGGYWLDGLDLREEIPCAPLRFDCESETLTVDQNRLFPRKLADGTFVPFENQLFLINRTLRLSDVEVVRWNRTSPTYEATLAARVDFSWAILCRDGVPHILGYAWHRIDPNAREVIAIQAAPFPSFHDYGSSAHYGLVARGLLHDIPKFRAFMSAESLKNPSLDDKSLRRCTCAIRADLDGAAEIRARASLSRTVPPDCLDAHVAAGMQFIRDGATLGLAPKTRPRYAHQLDERWQLEIDRTWQGSAEDIANIRNLSGPVSLVLSDVPDSEAVIQVLQSHTFDNLCALIIENMPLDDEALARLTCLPQLQALYLVNTQVTDDGLLLSASATRPTQHKRVSRRLALTVHGVLHAL